MAVVRVLRVDGLAPRALLVGQLGVLAKLRCGYGIADPPTPPALRQEAVSMRFCVGVFWLKQL